MISYKLLLLILPNRKAYKTTKEKASMFDFQKHVYLLGAQIETLAHLLRGDILSAKTFQDPSLMKKVIKEMKTVPHKAFHVKEITEHKERLYKIVQKHKLDEHKNPWVGVKLTKEVVQDLVDDILMLRKDLWQLFHDADNLKATQKHVAHIVEQLDTLVFKGIFNTLCEHIQKNKKHKSFFLNNAIAINAMLQSYAVEAERHLGGNHALKEATLSTELLMQTARA